MKILSGSVRRPLRSQAHAQILLDGEIREDLAPLWHVADAEPRARSRASGRTISCPSNFKLPERDGRRPMITLSSVVLPTPLRPMRHTQLPAGTLSPTSHSVWLPP